MSDLVHCEACGGVFDRTIGPRCFCGWSRPEDVERFEKEAARQRERVGAVIPYRDRPPVATVRPLHPVVEGLIHLAGGCACEVVWWVQAFRESGLPVAIVRTRARRSVE